MISLTGLELTKYFTTSKIEGEVGPVKLVYAPSSSRVVVLLWFFVDCFCDRASLKFHLTCVHIIFSLMSVAEWPPFRK